MSLFFFVQMSFKVSIRLNYVVVVATICFRVEMLNAVPTHPVVLGKNLFFSSMRILSSSSAKASFSSLTFPKEIIAQQHSCIFWSPAANSREVGRCIRGLQQKQPESLVAPSRPINLSWGKLLPTPASFHHMLKWRLWLRDADFSPPANWASHFRHLTKWIPGHKSFLSLRDDNSLPFRPQEKYLLSWSLFFPQ